MSKADSPTKLCTEADCGRPLRARGLCATHYNRSRYTPDERIKKITVPCGWCAKPCVKAPDKNRGYAERFCSLECRDNMRAFRVSPRHPRLVTHLTSRHRAHPDYGLPVIYVSPPAKVVTKRPRIAFTAGWCRNCGRAFVDRWLADRSSMCCSPRCARRRAKDQRRARQKAAYLADVSRVAIFERDGYRCQLCGRKTKRNKEVPHPLAPVLDHIIPLALGVEAGGVHAPHNVQCAHFLCNSQKSDSIVTVQLMLFG
jgi:hypothetical protein